MHNPTADLDQSKELVSRVVKLKAELERIQEYRGEVFEYLNQIEREISFIERKQNPENENDNKVLRSLKNMKRRIENIENLLNIVPTDEDENSSYYKVKLRRILNFGILDIESENLSISAQFKGVLFEIISELLKKYIEDSKTDVPIEFRGYVSRNSIFISQAF